jgi:hypothetical protein
MQNKNQLLSVRLSIPEMRTLKSQYEQRKQQMAEHCPSIEIQGYRFSDYVREVLKVKANGKG